MEKDPLLQKREGMSVVKWDDLKRDVLMVLGTVDDGLRLALCRDKEVYTCHHLMILGEDDSIMSSTFGNIEQIIQRAERILRQYRERAAGMADPLLHPVADAAGVEELVHITFDPVAVGDTIRVERRGFTPAADYKILSIVSVQIDDVFENMIVTVKAARLGTHTLPEQAASDPQAIQ